MMNCPFDSISKIKISPFKVFISHSGKDKEIVESVADILKSRFKEIKCVPYIGERNTIGRPLTSKLREELLDSNSVLVVWTKNAKKISNEIIGFETGMAWASNIPVFVLKDKSIEITWFYRQITDYVEIENFEDENILEKKMSDFDFLRYHNPICFCFPKQDTTKRNSENEIVVWSDGSIHLWNEFNGIIHFITGNHTNRIIRDIRITIEFPEYIEIRFNPGGTGAVQRNEMFDMKKLRKGVIRLMWVALPSDEHWSTELRLIIPKLEKEISENVHIRIQGGEYSKKEIDVPLKIHSHRVTEKDV